MNDLNSNLRIINRVDSNLTVIKDVFGSMAVKFVIIKAPSNESGRLNGDMLELATEWLFLSDALLFKKLRKGTANARTKMNTDDMILISSKTYKLQSRP